MELDSAQLEELKGIATSITVLEEAGVPYILLEGAAMPKGASPAKVDLLLCPVQQGGYQTRLYFSQQVTGPKARNWNGKLRIGERNWVAYSWQVTNGTSLRYIQMVKAHLEALR